MEEKRKCRICGCTDGDCRQCIEKTGKPCHWVAEDLCSACKTTVVSFASIKGGTGKTNIAILIAKGLAAAGKRVLLIDFDLNNSLSFHFINDDEMEKTKSLNIAAALSDESNNLCDYTVPARMPGIDIIASTPYLADLRTLSEKRLKRMIPTLYGKYDICIIDCPPTYDNIVLNAVNASDYTITPVLKDLFSYNAAVFFSSVLPRDVEGFKNWFVLINGYDKRFEEAKSGRQSDFLELYRKGEFPLTPVETWLPWTTQVHLIVDYHKDLTCKKGTPGAVYNPELYKAVMELASCFFDGDLLIPEVF
jgi:chromosome partitioning protein